MKMIIIGGGPGGYEAAIMAAKLGADVTVVEKDKLGGTCLNKGCIPTKSLLASADIINTIKSASKFGIEIEGTIKSDYSKIIERKDKVVDQLVGGIEFLFKKNKVRLVKGTGSFVDSKTIEVVKDDGSKELLTADKIIIATGSVPVCPGVFKYNGVNVITSDEFLELKEAPSSIIIVGGGAIGCEIGQFLKAMGTDVTIVEMLSQILPNEDEDVSKQLLRQFKKDKIKVITNNGISAVEVFDNKVKTVLQDGKELEADLMLVSIGRRSFTDNLNLDNMGINKDSRGRIIVNNKMETNIDGIYAIGDIIDTPLLAHVASKEGIIAAENALGADKKISYKAVPRGVYTEPEVAGVGLTEKQVIESGILYKIGTFEFRGLGKAQVVDKIQGFVKIIVDKDDVIIGASIVGSHAIDLLAELTLAVECELTAEKVGNAIHPHPTLSEGIMEALHDVHNKSINKI